MTKFAVLLAIYITSFVVIMACGVGQTRPAFVIDWYHVAFAFMYMAIPALLGFIIAMKMVKEWKK